ncbi:MAG: hypothetical protein R2787_14355 [Saprospiraceae bacterium]
MIKILEKTSSKFGLITLTAIQLVVGAFLGITLSKLSKISGNGIPDFEVGYTKEKILELFNSYGEQGMELYNQVHLIDLFNPLIYSLLFASLCYYFFKDTRFEKLSLIPFLAGFFDYFENSFLYQMKGQYPEISDNLIEISNSISLIKYVVLGITIATFIFGIFQWIKKKN